MLWAHRVLFPIEEGEKDVAPLYQIIADRIGRSNTACRIKLFHIKHNVRKGAISLEDALAAKRLPLQEPKKLREKAAEKGAVSPKRAPSTKKSLSVPASKARKQAAAEKGALSPKAAVSNKPLLGQTCESQEQAPTERRGSSSEDALDKEPRSGAASKPQHRTSAERRTVSPEDVSAEKLPSGPAFKPQKLTPDEKAAQFRSRDGARVADERLTIAGILVGMKTQERVPDDSTTSRQDTPMPMSWGQLNAEDRSAGLQRLMELHNIEQDED